MAASSQSVGTAPASMLMTPFATPNVPTAFEKHPIDSMPTQIVTFHGSGPQFVNVQVPPQPLYEPQLKFETPAEHAGFANNMRLQETDAVSQNRLFQHQELARGDSQSEDNAEIVTCCSASESGAYSDSISGRELVRRKKKKHKRKHKKKPVPSHLKIVPESILSGNQAVLVDNTDDTIVFQKTWARSNRYDFHSKRILTIKEEAAQPEHCLMRIKDLGENDATLRMSYVDGEKATRIGFRVGMKIQKLKDGEIQKVLDDRMEQIEDTIKESNIDFQKDGVLRARSHQFCIEANLDSDESIMFGPRAFKAIMEKGVEIDKIADAPRKKGRRYFILVPHKQSVNKIRDILTEDPVLKECVSQRFKVEKNKFYRYSRVAQKLHNQDIEARGYLKHEFFDTLDADLKHEFFDTLDAARRIFPEFGKTKQSEKHYEERMIKASDGRNPADKQVVEDADNAFKKVEEVLKKVEEFLKKVESTRPSTA